MSAYKNNKKTIKEKTSGYLFLLYRNDNGTNRTLRELGLLEKIENAVESNPKLTGKKGGTVEGRFIKQIAEGKGTEFRNTYNFLSEKFAIGTAIVEGKFNGEIYKNEDGSTHIEGIITYFFEDIFTDPYDLLNIIPGEWNPDGKPYKITDTWQKEINGDF